MDKVFIPLGNSCSITYNLKINNLRQNAYPFDWVRVQNLNNITNLIQNNFDGFLDINKYKFKSSSKKFNVNDNFTSYIYSNNYCTFYHEFENYIEKLDMKDFIDKYTRRINRLINIIKSNKKIIFIREEYGDVKINKIYKFIDTIKKINPNINYYLVIISSKNISFTDPKIKCFVSSKPINDWRRPEINWNEIFNLF